ncbi:MAG: phosphate ABC transporter ATP-binding protein [Pseudobacteriovorax sp.]|nr:phosphate ABC transporter ATP-binding protein [Pseudobacteriovorax sp.]
MSSEYVLETKDLSLSYGDNQVVNNVSVGFKEKAVTALIGPSGCGKSTLLRTFNRMNDFIDVFSHSGEVLFRGKDIYNSPLDVTDFRRNVGMVFQKPNPFSSSIKKNITWGPKINGYQGDFDELVETSLKKASLWNEVKDKLNSSGLDLSGGQQQRLCIARAIAMDPSVILMDEPCSALDPQSTAAIEKLITELQENYTIIIVTHNMQQAARISEDTAFMYEGDLVEVGETSQLFSSPEHKLTQDYIGGRFG